MHFLESRSANYLEERLGKSLESGSAFVVFRPPGAASLTCLWESGFDARTDLPGEFVFVPFDPDQPGLVFNKPRGFHVDCASLPDGEAFEPVTLYTTPKRKEAYVRNFKNVLKAIQSGEVTKVVLSRAEALPVQRDPWSLFLRLQQRYASACCYWWYHPDTGHWLGATPELLISAEGDEVEIMSLAGTALAESDNQVKWSEKELKEQHLVTQYIEDLLRQYGKRLRIMGPETIQAGNLYHLRTILKAKIDLGLDGLIRHLHPTPAVCGYPTQSAYRVIAEQEGYDREYYTGYFGIRSTDPTLRTQLYVNLRCLKWTADSVTIYAGGGITESSDPESEWQETVNKTRTMLDIMDITLA